ncbi:MAG: TIR domain-containing protein [Cyanobacteria bacterium P01_D01_bin.115]
MPDSADYQARLQLRRRLLALPGPQLDDLIYTLQPPAGNVPPASSASAARVTALLAWVESPIGCGLAALKHVLAAVEGDSGEIANTATPPASSAPSASGKMSGQGENSAPPPSPINPPATDENPTYDVFISYSTQDKHWVRGELLSTLEAAGLRVGIDFRDFRPGAPTITEIERLAEVSERTLLVLTPAYVASEWTEFETLLLQTFDPVNKDLRLIPLRKAPCEIPKRLKIFTYVDFAEPDDLEFTWRRLLTALGKPPQAEPADPPDTTPHHWLLAHPYGMPPHFTGRQTELGMLNDWLNGANTPPLFVLRALGGFGKSTLTWHWLTETVSPQQWPQVVWWSFYETSASFENFVRNTLAYVTGQASKNVPPREQLDRLLTLLQNQRVLLVMDGFERELRAYSGMGAAHQGDEVEENSATPVDRGSSTVAAGAQRGDAGRDCISHLAEDFLRRIASLPHLQGKVLMSTRLRPRAVEVTGGLLLQGCQESELTQMEPEDAVAFFQKQGIRGGRAEIEQTCGAYGYHPLSLRLLAGYILNDFEQPGDVKVAEHLDLTGNLVQRRNHVLARSYENLSVSARKLLGQIACFRSPVQIKVLEQVGQLDDAGHGSAMTLRNGLRDLLNRGLLQFDRGTQRFDLHPIVRRYAYNRLTATDRTAAHSQLCDYFAAVPEPERVQTLEDLEPVIELYHHQVRAGQYDNACDLFYEHLHDFLYYQLGAYQICAELLRSLFPHGEDQLPQLQDEGAQAWTLNSLANSYSLSGQPAKAIPLFERRITIAERREDKTNLAISLGNLAIQQLSIDALQAAEANLRRVIALCQEINNESREAVGHAELGRLLAYRGAWPEAAVELDKALKLFDKTNNIQPQSYTCAYRALTALLQVRAGDPSAAAIALTAAERTLKLADEWQQEVGLPNARDYVRVHWVLGAAHRVDDHLAKSDTHLSDALTRCRIINMVDHEADILLDLARLRADQSQPKDALRLADEALAITDRSGYVLQGADVRLFLAQQALTRGNEAQALDHARQARQLARCDGGEHTYKVAYDEAGALLQSLGHPPTE